MTNQTIVYAHGKRTLVNQHPDGSWDCPKCGSTHPGVAVEPHNEQRERELRWELGEWDVSEVDRWRRNEDLSRHDFESPFEAA